MYLIYLLCVEMLFWNLKSPPKSCRLIIIDNYLVLCLSTELGPNMHSSEIKQNCRNDYLASVSKVLLFKLYPTDHLGIPVCNSFLDFSR